MDTGVGECGNRGGGGRTCGESGSQVDCYTSLLDLERGHQVVTDIRQSSEGREGDVVPSRRGVCGPFLLSLVSCLCADSCFRRGVPIRLTQRHPLPREYSNIPHLSLEFCRSITDSALGLLWNGRTRSRLRSSTQLRHTSILSARSDSCPRTSSLRVNLQAVTFPWHSSATLTKAISPTYRPLEGSLPHRQVQTCPTLARSLAPPTSSTRNPTYSTSHAVSIHSPLEISPSARTSVK